MALVETMTKHLCGEVHHLRAYEAQIKPCIDCRYCWEQHDCAISDDMDAIYDLIESVDNIIVASPIYFSELTGALLNLMSLLQRYYAIKYIQRDKGFGLKEKLGGLILVGGGDGNANCAMHTADVLFRLMNVKSQGTVLSHNTNRVPASEDIMALKQARDLAERLKKANTKDE